MCKTFLLSGTLKSVPLRFCAISWIARTGNCDKPNCAFAHDERWPAQREALALILITHGCHQKRSLRHIRRHGKVIHEGLPLLCNAGNFERRRASSRPSSVALQTAVVASRGLETAGYVAPIIGFMSMGGVPYSGVETVMPCRTVEISDRCHFWLSF